MKRKLTTFIATILLAIMVLSMFSACGGEKTDNKTNEGGIETETLEDPKIPAKDYEQYEFTFVSQSGNYSCGYVYSEAETGDMLDDAIYRRNQIIEEKYNITVNHVEVGDIISEVRSQIMSGGHDYDVIIASCSNLSTLAQEGALYNLLSIDRFDFEKSYWDKNSLEQLNMGGKVYFANNALNINTIGFCTFFNKKLIEDYQLERPYDLIESGDWTIDKWAEMVMSISKDMNNDGAMTEFDQYGTLAEHHNPRMFLYASGVRATTNDENGYPQLTLMENKDKTVGIYSKLKEVFSDPDHTFCIVCANIQVPEGYAHKYSYCRYLFTQDLYLFHYCNEQAGLGGFAEMESEFGLIPFPKYDKSQETYNTVYPYNNLLFALPSNMDAEILERTANIVEDMNYYSSIVLVPVWFDTLLARRYARDDESEASLRLLRDNCVYDIGLYYNFGGIRDTVLDADPRTSNIARNYDKIEKSIKKNIDKIYAEFQKVQ